MDGWMDNSTVLAGSLAGWMDAFQLLYFSHIMTISIAPGTTAYSWNVIKTHAL